MTAALAGVCGVLGLAVGSFLNVVIHRVPRKESVVRPRSKCPECDTEIAPRDNIPVVSWLLLQGRCRTCQTPIARRYPLVELATGLLFAGVALRLGEDWALPAFLVFTASLIALSAIDLELFILPNRIIYPTLFITAALLAAAAAANGDWRRLRDAGIGAAIGWGILLVIHLISPRGMGFGDVRLAALIGLHLGWLGPAHVFLGLFFGFLLASLIGIALVVTRKKGRKDAVPFGPFLALGAMLALFAGVPVLDWYL